jgi:hypothetical protein
MESERGAEVGEHSRRTVFLIGLSVANGIGWGVSHQPYRRRRLSILKDYPRIDLSLGLLPFNHYLFTPVDVLRTRERQPGFQT